LAKGEDENKKEALRKQAVIIVWSVRDYAAEEIHLAKIRERDRSGEVEGSLRSPILIGVQRGEEKSMSLRKLWKGSFGRRGLSGGLIRTLLIVKGGVTQRGRDWVLHEFHASYLRKKRQLTELPFVNLWVAHLRKGGAKTPVLDTKGCKKREEKKKKEDGTPLGDSYDLACQVV